MKKYYLIIILFSLLFISCEEEFDPKGTYREKYILNCIVRADTTLQFATVLKSYNVDGFDPFVKTEEVTIPGADIRIFYRNQAFRFKDSTIFRNDTSRYNTPMNIYYTEDFVPNFGDSIEIRAVLPNGRVMTSITKLPNRIIFPTGNTRLIPDDIRGNPTFLWPKSQNVEWYLPRFVIVYRITENGVPGPNRRIEVPFRTANLNGVEQPYYPVITGSNQIRFQQSLFDETMRELGKTVANKADVTVFGAVLELIVFDESLSIYLSSTNGYFDEYTIRVDENDFTNIKDGFGIFGSFIKQQSGVVLENSYVRSFGYSPANP